MFSTDELSCSDCKLEKLEQTERRWRQLLLNWINKCVHPTPRAKQLNAKTLFEVMAKYKHDCADENDKAILLSEDIEYFLKIKYPVLRLRNFYEEHEQSRKLYLMASILLFHCCVNSRAGEVDSDICSRLGKDEQEMVLRFCERLSEMEATGANIDCAVKAACDSVPISEKPSEAKSKTSSINASETSDTSVAQPDPKTFASLKFKSSVTVLPSVVTDTSTYSDMMSSYIMRCGEDSEENNVYSDSNELNVFTMGTAKSVEVKEASKEAKPNCPPQCSCTQCTVSGPSCGDPGSSMDKCSSPPTKAEPEPFDIALLKMSKENFRLRWSVYSAVIGIVVLAIVITVLATVPNWKKNNSNRARTLADPFTDDAKMFRPNTWICKNNLCQKVYKPTSSELFTSFSRCVLICMGPQLWPIPIGYTHYSNQIVALATTKLEYKFQSVPSEAVNQYLAEAFKLFLGDLARLERIGNTPRNVTQDLTVRKMSIQIDVDTDSDPRLRLNTEEAYSLKIETIKNQVLIKVSSASFCGVRHGLETLSQLILLDQSTGYLITLSAVVIKDAPSYKYRGLMIDTGRNYIPIPDLMRTIDAMATTKLNTLHWRITDVTSFPLYLPRLPELFTYGAYGTSMVYTKEDIKSIVNRAGIRGIRILMEVAAPGPVGRAWSWAPGVTCPTKNDNHTCDNILCLRLRMQDSILDILQIIYEEILEMTKVDDIFHLSDSVFALTNCFYLIEDRVGFLDKVLHILKLANKGFLPKLPVIWFTPHLASDLEAKTWEMLGVQLHEMPDVSEQYLSKYKVIHSSKWDLSCDVQKQRCKRYRTWQEMYAWKNWRNIEVFTIEGGEALLWTDLVDSSNLDYHLWPRAAAVAERLWSDIVVNASANGLVYARLDSHRSSAGSADSIGLIDRWRLLMKAVKVQPIWPMWCSFNVGTCLEKVK